MTTELITRRARTEPSIPGYRCIGIVSHTSWIDWPQWVFERVKIKHKRQHRIAGGKVRSAA